MVDRPSGNPLHPTFRGYISCTMDALILFEACLVGRLSHVPRRPHDRERASLITSGNVFIYEEHSSGIKRWTDGVPWSPSRILGNFLLYRELDKPFQPGEKKRAMKRSKPESGVSKSGGSSRSNSITGFSSILPNGTMTSYDSPVNGRSDTERALVGSLIDSYQFKQDGLVKKTISVQHRGVQHHLVSYYSIDDVSHGRLKTPGETSQLSGITPRSSLISSANFRAPVDDSDLLLGPGPEYRTYMYGGAHGLEYGTVMNGPSSRSMSMPSAQPYQHNTWGGPQQYMSNTTWGPTLPPPISSYTQSATPQYSYDPSSVTPYRMPQQTSTNFNSSSPLQARRHSTMHGSNGTHQIGYSGLGSVSTTQVGSPSLLSNNSGLGSHSLGHSAYGNGPMYEASAAAVTSNHPSSSYEATSSVQAFDASNSGQQPTGFEDQMGNNFDPNASRQHPTEFGSSAATGYGSAGGATSTGVQLQLEQEDSAPNGITEADWHGDYITSDGYSQSVVVKPDSSTG
ncbi:Gti1/Pac2 family-domain-containing protein [Xylariaceae sp. FL0662B]|nr:Gti1/Pac2 family-domain-containing protein [Xylariaceae sp. FL0662B]